MNCQGGENSITKRAASEDRLALWDVRQPVRPATARRVGAATLCCVARPRREEGILINGIRSGIEGCLRNSSGRRTRRPPAEATNRFDGLSDCAAGATRSSMLPRFCKAPTQKTSQQIQIVGIHCQHWRYCDSRAAQLCFAEPRPVSFGWLR